MNIVGASRARAQLSRLLDRAAKGERIVITRRSRPVAELRPISSEQMLTPIEAAAALRVLRVGVTLGDVELRDLRPEGRP